MIKKTVKCDYCGDDLDNYLSRDFIHVCKIKDTNDETDISIIHLCLSCYDFYVLDHPEMMGIELLEHKTKNFDNILSEEK